MGDLRTLCTVAGLAVSELDGAVLFKAGLQIDADGAPNAYHPKGRPYGLEKTSYAGRPGNWWGIATDTGRGDGQPIIQGPNDPFPGGYVSTTALRDRTKSDHDPTSYVDARVVPYLSLPGRIDERKSSATFSSSTGLYVGDLFFAFYRMSASDAIWGDVGPDGNLGEGSIALAQRLGLYTSLDNGHDEPDVVFIGFRMSHARPAWPWEPERMREAAAMLLENWGGRERVVEIFPHLEAA